MTHSKDTVKIFWSFYLNITKHKFKFRKVCKRKIWNISQRKQKLPIKFPE